MWKRAVWSVTGTLAGSLVGFAVMAMLGHPAFNLGVRFAGVAGMGLALWYGERTKHLKTPDALSRPRTLFHYDS